MLRISRATLSGEFSFVGGFFFFFFFFWGGLFVQVVVSLPPLKKKNWSCISVSCSWSRQKEGVQWRRCVGRRLRDGAGPRISGTGEK
jgi:hypothetical protein